MYLSAYCTLVFDVFFITVLCRFHPDHIQEFLAMRKKKSEGWKCDVSFDLIIT